MILREKESWGTCRNYPLEIGILNLSRKKKFLRGAPSGAPFVFCAWVQTLSCVF